MSVPAMKRSRQEVGVAPVDADGYCRPENADMQYFAGNGQRHQVSRSPAVDTIWRGAKRLPCRSKRARYVARPATLGKCSADHSRRDRPKRNARLLDAGSKLREQLAEQLEQQGHRWHRTSASTVVLLTRRRRPSQCEASVSTLSSLHGPALMSLLLSAGPGDLRNLGCVCQSLRLEVFAGTNFWETVCLERTPSFAALKPQLPAVLDLTNMPSPDKERFTRFLWASIVDLRTWISWASFWATEGVLRTSTATGTRVGMQVVPLVSVVLRRVQLVDEGCAALSHDYSAEAALSRAEGDRAAERAAQAEAIANAADVVAVRRLSSDIASMHRKIGANCEKLAVLLEERLATLGNFRRLALLIRTKCRKLLPFAHRLDALLEVWRKRFSIQRLRSSPC